VDAEVRRVLPCQHDGLAPVLRHRRRGAGTPACRWYEAGGDRRIDIDRWAHATIDRGHFCGVTNSAAALTSARATPCTSFCRDVEE